MWNIIDWVLFTGSWKSVYFILIFKFACSSRWMTKRQMIYIGSLSLGGISRIPKFSVRLLKHSNATTLYTQCSATKIRLLLVKGISLEIYPFRMSYVCIFIIKVARIHFNWTLLTDLDIECNIFVSIVNGCGLVINFF